MKNLFVVLVSLGIAQVTYAHPDERVSIELQNDQIQAGEQELVFDLIDEESSTLITDQELAVSHEKKLHFIVYDPALLEFFHVHPEYSNDHWRVKINPTVNGNYFVWAQGVIAADKEEFSADGRLLIQGGTTENPTPPKLTDDRQDQVGKTLVTLSNEKLKAGKSAMLTITVSRSDGTNPEITPYLGALAHVNAVFEKGDTLVHVHPMGTSNPNEMMLHATFKDPGLYRVWIEVIDAGVLKKFTLAVEVFK